MDVELVLSDKSKNTDLLVVIEGVTWHSEISQVHCEKMDLPCGEVVFVGVSLINQVKLVFRPNVIFLSSTAGDLRVCILCVISTCPACSQLRECLRSGLKH